jgi:hypothetical protein
MRLFRRCHYQLVKGRDSDRDMCLIIVTARRVGDGPFLEAVCTAFRKIVIIAIHLGELV